MPVSGGHSGTPLLNPPPALRAGEEVRAERLPRSRGRAGWGVPLVATVLSACGAGNSLNGSMATLTPLAYTGVAVKLQGSSLVIEYENFVDGGGNIPFELTYNTAGTPLDAGHTFLLDAGTAAGLPKAVASRTVVGDNRAFSPIDRGFLTLNGPVVLDQAASGSFFTVFTYQSDGSLGSGRTVYGNFDATVTK